MLGFVNVLDSILQTYSTNYKCVSHRNTSIVRFRVYSYLCRGVRNFVRDHAEIAVEKEYYLSLVDVPTRHKIRELTTQKIGTLVRISGQVGRGGVECYQGDINIYI